MHDAVMSQRDIGNVLTGIRTFKIVSKISFFKCERAKVSSCFLKEFNFQSGR